MSKHKAHTRYRNKNGDIVVGVTTVTGILDKPQLVGWSNRIGLQGIAVDKYVSDKADIGTLAHAIITNGLQGKETNTDDYSKNQITQAENSVLSYYEWEKGHKLEPIMIEEQLVSERYQYGGTADFYGKVDGVNELIDLKTGSGIYLEALIQTVAYRQLLEENGHQVDRIRILNIPRAEDEEFDEKIITNFEPYWKVFKRLREIYGIIDIRSGRLKKE